MKATDIELRTPSSKLHTEDLSLYAKVVIDLPVSIRNNDFYFYSIPEELIDEVKPGTVVHVPFGKQELNGYITEISNESQSGFEIKPIYSVVYTDPIWDKNFLTLAEWMSHYYLTNTGTILSASVSSDIFDQYIHEVTLIKSVIDNYSCTKEQLFIIEKLLKSKNQRLSYKYLNQKAKFNKHRFYQLINQLKSKGVITVTSHWKKASKFRKNNTSVYDTIQLDKKNIILNKEQKEAYESILKTITNKKHEVFLLHGITGSGKTEVYLRLIQEALKYNKNAVYLVPEIYLIPQTYQRLKSKFQDTDIVIWHSALNKSERFKNWELLKNSKSLKIILGARSAILSPINNIGIVIADEAYEASYKQSGQTPRYDAIKVAIKRGDIENCPVVLGTATPNINDYYECSQRNTVLELPNRIDNISMPSVHIIDLKTEYPRSYKNIISNSLKTHIETALKRNEQIILLLNRRGYSSHVFCRACGHTIFCHNCSVPMVYHKNLHALICHHCGNEKFIGKALILQCPECKSPHFGHIGIGTQQLEDETKKIFPGARVLRVDSDQLKRKDEYIKLWQSFASHNSDLLIGTQIVAKGIDIPDVTVVGVIMADTMLNFPDYVSYERAFQLLTQVTGRAGRREKKGIVFIQTYKPEEPLFKYIKEHDYKGFYNAEIKHRKELLYPPFTKLHRIIIQSYEEKECISYANKISKELRAPSSKFNILGPAPCFFSKLHGKYRYHILCKANNDEIKSHLFKDLLNNARKNAKVEVIIDIDSINLL